MSSVYLQRFNLERQPFALLPDAEFFFGGEQRASLLHALQQAVLDDAGLLVVQGEVGTGKTMLCRMLASGLARHGLDVAFVPDGSLPRDTLLTAIAADLGVHVPVPEQAVLALQQALAARSTEGARRVILIDEAHTMQADALDAVRMLMNVETPKRKLLQIVLFGQPELSQMLSQPRLRQVRDRIAHQFTLQPLSDDGAKAYLEHRLRIAGWQGERLVESAAMSRLVGHAAGRFRSLGLLADKALLAAYSDGARSVASNHVKKAWRELASHHGWRAQPMLARWREAARGLTAQAHLPSPFALQMAGMSALGVAAALWGLQGAPALQPEPSAPPPLAQSTDYDVLLRRAPPAALPAAAAQPYHTIQLASLPSQEAAHAEIRRLQANTDQGQPLFVLYRPSKGPRAGQPGRWIVCTGRFERADLAMKEQQRTASTYSLKAVRTLKVEG